MKIFYYKLLKVIINIFDIIKVIVSIVIYYHRVFDFIISDCSSVFIMKFLLLLYYFFGIRQKLLIVFDPQTDDQSIKQISNIETYF